MRTCIGDEVLTFFLLHTQEPESSSSIPSSAPAPSMESSGHALVTQASLQRAEFFAEDELIEISPSVKSGVVSLVAGDFGPFEPTIALRVPLWLALAMKKLRRCRIIPPRWIAHREVEKVIATERDLDAVLQPLPHYFSQVRRALAAPRFLLRFARARPPPRRMLAGVCSRRSGATPCSG